MKKILVCIKEEKLREKIKETLEDQFEMILTDSKDQALELMKTAEISSILTDENNLDEFKDVDSNIKVIPLAYNSIFSTLVEQVS